MYNVFFFCHFKKITNDLKKNILKLQSRRETKPLWKQKENLLKWQRSTRTNILTF